MPNIPQQNTTKQNFLDSVETLDLAMKVLELMHSIEVLSRQPMDSSTESLTKLKADLQATRKNITLPIRENGARDVEDLICRL